MVDGSEKVKERGDSEKQNHQEAHGDEKKGERAIGNSKSKKKQLESLS